MSRMQTPMMEVLRFDSEDVVVASGGAAGPIELTQGTRVHTLTSEYTESRDGGKEDNPLWFSPFTYTGNADNPIPPEQMGLDNNEPSVPGNSAGYAWFNDGKWFYLNGQGYNAANIGIYDGYDDWRQ